MTAKNAKARRDGVAAPPAKAPPPPAESKPDPKGAKAEKEPKSDHDLLAEIQDQYRKIAKLEAQIADLKAAAKARREALGTANRELRHLLAGQGALPFGKPGKPEKLETLDGPAGDWVEVREIGTNKLVVTLRVGDPHLDDFRKRPRDFVVRPLQEPPVPSKQPAANDGGKQPAGAATTRASAGN